MICFLKHLPLCVKQQSAHLVSVTMTFKLWVAQRYIAEILPKCELVDDLPSLLLVVD